MFCLLALKSNSFNSHISSLVLRIKQITLKLHQSNYSIQFLSIPSHIGIHGNEVVNNLAESTASLISPPLTQLHHTDIIPFIRHHIRYLSFAQWLNIPAEMSTRYKYIVPTIPHNNWFNNLYLSRATIDTI